MLTTEAAGTDRCAQIEALVREWNAMREDPLEPLEVDEPLTMRSLEAAELGVLIEARIGVAPQLETLLEGLPLRELVERLTSDLEQGEASGAPATDAPAGIEPLPAERHEPFAMTPVQQAYFVGRSGAFELGGVSSHVYYEWDARNIDFERLTDAFQRIIEHHDMLRAIVPEDGRQRVIEHVDPYVIDVDDLCGATPEEAEARLDATRREMSHQVLPSDTWPLFDVRAHALGGGRARIHFSIDMLIADATSIMVVLRDWQRLYEDPRAELTKPEIAFRDIVVARAAQRENDAFAKAREYWLERIDTLPSAPELPMARNTAPRPGSARCFCRREATIGAAAWTRLQERARAARVTPSAFVCAAYADTLRRWTEQPRFTLNLTLNDRPLEIPETRDLVGDFTSTILLEVDLDGADNFDEKAQRVHRRLSRDLDHSVFPGVDVQRAMARRQGAMTPRMPVVFTSLIGMPAADRPAMFEQTAYAITQTPQVHLDHQVMERDGALHVIWDCVEELFPEGMIDSMFAAYVSALRLLAEGADDVDGMAVLPPAELEGRERANATEHPIAEGLLHAGIVPSSATAVVARDRSLTYDELDALANRIARRLRDLGARPNQLVGIVMEKGWQQAVAALAIARSGAAYLPIDAGLPPKRIAELVEIGAVEIVLTQAHVEERTQWPEGLEQRLVVDDDAAWEALDGSPLEDVATVGDLAYVIFTSGSTGTPKGVMIEHGAANNTIVDCIERFRMSAEDRVLALSSLSFDLSVFDVFATLRVGGTLVVPEPEAMRNPGRWAELVRDELITVWNSVPALFDMLVEFANGRRDAVGDSLRLAMLSGDWIPVDLPARARALVPGLEIVSMGGATEASIWSVLYDVGPIDPAWSSIPYGRPMANQTMHVLDANLEPCPVWVAGELLIGGRGLATGYWRDELKTAERFIEHPRTGERLYRTGDLARYRPDGTLEFLGRADHQVKIRGYRVELGEIEAALNEHQAIRAAVVTAHGEKQGPKRLVAYCVSDVDDLGACDLRRFLGARLPEYMVPQTFIPLDALPLSSNGKVDRAALPAPDWTAPNPMACAAPAPPAAGAADADAPAAASSDRARAEAILTEAWTEVLGLPEVARDQDFFDLGGDSLLAMRVIAKVGAEGLSVDPERFFDTPTIAAVAEIAEFEELRQVTTETLVTGEVPLTPSQLWFFERDFADPSHWNGFWPLLSVSERLDPVLLGAALHKVLLHHDALRTRFVRDDEAQGGWRAFIRGPEAATPVPLELVDLSELPEDEKTPAMEQRCADSQATLDLFEGPVLRITYFDFGEGQPGRLHLAAHWAVVDYYSSRVFFEDFWTAYTQLRDGQEVSFPPKTTSVADFSRRLRERAQDPAVRAELPQWATEARRSTRPLLIDHHHGPNDQASSRQVMLMLDEEETTAVMRELPLATDCDVSEALLAAVARAVSRWSEQDSVVVETEAHGRLPGVDGIDLSRTVGRCSSFTPFHLQVSHDQEARESLRDICAQMRQHPNRGVGYGLLRYLSEDPEVHRQLDGMEEPAMNFNFWGHLNEYLEDAILPFQESTGALQSARGLRPRVLDVFGMVIAGSLALVFIYSENLHRRETVEQLAEFTGQELRQLTGRAGMEGDAEEFMAPITVVPFDEDAFVQPSEKAVKGR